MGLFSGILKDSFLSGERLGARIVILTESDYWLASLKNKVRKDGRTMLTFTNVNLRHIQ